MSNLIPVKRLDKNGRLVTRHVKADESNTSGQSLPAPAASSSKHPSTRGNYAKEIAEFLLEAADDEDRNQLSKLYTKYVGLSQLRLIHGRMNNWDEQECEIVDDGINKIIAQHVINNASLSMSNQLVTSLVESVSVIRAFHNGHPRPEDTYDYLTIANESAQINRVNVNHDYVSEDERSAFRFLAFEAVIGAPSESKRSADLQEDAGWFDENMETLYLHGATLRERKTSDREFLRTLIADDTTSALTSGLL